MDDLIKDFLVESNENLDRLDSELVQLEAAPSSHGLLSSVFRTIHTIKGSCGFLGFGKLEKVAHVGESLLSRLRDGKLSLNPGITSALLSMVDAIRTMLEKIEATNEDGEETYPDLLERLTRLQTPAQDAAPSAPAKSSSNESGGARTPEHTEESVADRASGNCAAESAQSVQLSPPAAFHATSEDAQNAQRPPEDARSRGAASETIRVDVHLLDRLM